MGFEKKEPPVFRVFLAAFIGILIMGSLSEFRHPALVHGLALSLPGLALLVKPPTRGLGRLGDLAVVGLLLSLLLAFVPQFYWPDARWRMEAVDLIGIELPVILSIQPAITLEAWILVVANFAWLYAVLQWPVNLHGRRWLFLWFSLLLSGIASIVIWGNGSVSSDDADTILSTPRPFSDWKQTAHLFTLGGVATFAFSMQSFRGRALKPLLSVPATALCLTSLFLINSQEGVILYFVGICIWYLLRIRDKSFPRVLKLGLPLAAALLCLFVVNDRKMLQTMDDFFDFDSQPREHSRLNIYKDVSKMIFDAPLTGIGLGNFSAVFPQYRDASEDHQPIVHPESDFFWIASEGGFLAIGLLAVIAIAYARRCHGLFEGKAASFRVISLVIVIIFLIQSLIGVPGHQPAIFYVFILFAALALPRRSLPRVALPPFIWRALGCGLICIGLAWVTAGLFRLPWHSSLQTPDIEEKIRGYVEVADYWQARSAVNEWIAKRPLDWRAYYQSAQLKLGDSGNLEEAAEDFRRARFVEPIQSMSTFREGLAWLPYDVGRAMSAWSLALNREMDQPKLYYAEILRYVKDSPLKMEHLARLSECNTDFRVYFLSHVQGNVLMREIDKELAKNPRLSHFNLEDTAAIISNWIEHGDFGSAADFMAKYGDSFDNAWWLWSLLYKEQADYIKAVNVIRQSLAPPEIFNVQLDEASMVKLAREYAVTPTDSIKAMRLVHVYVQAGLYEQAMLILDRLFEMQEPPLELYFWRAECYYHLEEYVESWFAFESYLNMLWQLKQN